MTWGDGDERSCLTMYRPDDDRQVNAGVGQSDVVRVSPAGASIARHVPAATATRDNSTTMATPAIRIVAYARLALLGPVKQFRQLRPAGECLEAESSCSLAGFPR